MSTFDGIVAEFPRIRIDFFRLNPQYPAPVACFLSHVHSDHLQGLESLKSPFVYCSQATRKLLLTMEKYPHRMNFNKGILESRVQTYKHLKTVLRPIPLQTPTEIELSPREKIRVTLFDANHCTGAVMFLIEGNDKAVLYTGDVRAEPWWVNQLVRNPVLIPYTNGQSHLDRIYLDTTFAVKEDVHKNFPSKADGLSELLSKVSKYPPNTTFYFRAWTLGYEDVWIALSSFLRCKIHVDEYQWRLYSSLYGLNESTDVLHGFRFGNDDHAGCFTSDSSAIIHSCEPGTKCHSQLSKRSVVWITPIITRTRQGEEILELGAGGGGGDLYQVPLLDLTDTLAVEKLEQLLTDNIQDPNIRSDIFQKISSALDTGDSRLLLEGLAKDVYEDISLLKLVDLISKATASSIKEPTISRAALNGLPNYIHFPYSRHSSYSELCHLVSAFQPRDIYPCTVDVDSWTEEISMRSLFGHCCSSNTFTHDQYIRAIKKNHEATQLPNKKRKRGMEPTQSQSGNEGISTDNMTSQSFQTANDASLPTTGAFTQHLKDGQAKQHGKDIAHNLSGIPISGIAVASLQTGERDRQEILTERRDRDESTAKQISRKRMQQAIMAETSNVKWLDTPQSQADITPYAYSARKTSNDRNLKATSASGDLISQASIITSGSISASVLDSQSLIIPIQADEDLHHDAANHDHPCSTSTSDLEADMDVDVDVDTDVDFYAADIVKSPTSAPSKPHNTTRIQRRKQAFKAACRTLQDPMCTDWADYAPSSAGQYHDEEVIL